MPKYDEPTSGVGGVNFATDGSVVMYIEDTTKPPFRVYDGEMHENTEIDLAPIVPPEATKVLLRKT